MAERKQPGTAQLLRATDKMSRRTSLTRLAAAADLAELMIGPPAPDLSDIPKYQEIIGAQMPDHWAEVARKLAGQPFRFDGMELWRADGSAGGVGPLRSTSLLRTIEKPRKVGNTEIALCEQGYRLCTRVNPPASIIWALHDGATAQKMSRERLQAGLVNGCQILRRAQVLNNVLQKSFTIEKIERFITVFATRAAVLGEEGQQSIGAAPTDIYLDEYQRHSPLAEAIIAGGTGWQLVPIMRFGTPLSPGNHLTTARRRACEYMSFYKCSKCGLWQHPDIDVDEAGRVPVSANVGSNPHWDGRRYDKPASCADCTQPAGGCQRSGEYRCRELIMVCTKCGASLEHLRGKAGVQPDNLGGGAAVWWAQNVGPDHKPQIARGESWVWTRFDVGLYQLAHVYAKIKEAIEASGMRLAMNEEIGKPYTGGEGCMIQRHWVEATKLREMNCAFARRQPYIVKAVAVDWGDEEGAGTWALVAGLFARNQQHYWCLLGAEQFAGAYDEQGRRAAEWAVQGLGAQLAVVDYGFQGGRARHFAEALGGRERVFKVDHRLRRDKVADREWTVSDINMLGSQDIFSIPKARAFDHMVALLSRTDDPVLYIPYANPAEWTPYLEQLFNIYRGSGQRGRTALDGFEVVGDEHEGFRKAGPIHFADCLKFLLLLMFTPSHLQFFISRATRGQNAL